VREKRDYESRRRQDSYRRRLAVLKAAGSIFARQGYRGSTVEEIARAAGVSKGLVFHFFGSKQELFRALVEDCLDQWLALSEYRASAADENSLNELRRLFLASFEFVEQNPVLLLFSEDHEELLNSYQRQIARRNKRWRGRIRGTLEKGIQDGEITSMDVARASVIFHEIQTTMLANVALTGSTPRYDRRKIELAVDIFLQGIRQISTATESGGQV